MTERQSDKDEQVKPCQMCGGTGWLHGAQDWSERRLRKGIPYKSIKCDCRRKEA